MVWSRVRSNVLSRCAARLMLCVGVCALALGLAMPVAMAQEVQPKGSAAPKSQPAAPNTAAPAGPAPAAPPPGAAGAPGAAAPADEAWGKLCRKSGQTQKKGICLPNKRGLGPKP